MNQALKDPSWSPSRQNPKGRVFSRKEDLSKQVGPSSLTTDPSAVFYLFALLVFFFSHKDNLLPHIASVMYTWITSLLL